MKTMTCSQLGGACEMAFRANTFNEIAQMSKQHGIEMFQKEDAGHLVAMEKMQLLMQNPDAITDWIEQKRTEFESLPETLQDSTVS